MIYEANKRALKEDKDLLTIGTGLHIPTLDIPMEASSEKASFNSGKGKALGAVANRHAIKNKEQLSEDEMINALGLEFQTGLFGSGQVNGKDQSTPIELDLTIGLEIKKDRPVLKKIALAMTKKKLNNIYFEVKKQIENTHYSIKTSANGDVILGVNQTWLEHSDIAIQIITEKNINSPSPDGKIGASFITPTKIKLDGFIVEFSVKFDIKIAVPITTQPFIFDFLTGLDSTPVALTLTYFRSRFIPFQ